MDIQAYFDRIGYTGTSSPTRSNLERILRLHLETVPFENLDCCYSGRALSNEPGVLFDKVVRRRRGGVCFELNGLFYALLQAMGYDCHAVAVRLPHPGDTAPICHEAVVAVIDGKQYYCDVGFGGPGPKGLLPLDEDPVQYIDGQAFRVSRDGIHVSIDRLHEGSWEPTICYADLPCIWEDFTGPLYYFTHSPESWFVIQRIVNLCLPDGGSLALTNDQFTVRRNGQVIRRQLNGEEEVTKVLQEEFGLFL